jgi:hypothetical protein
MIPEPEPMIYPHDEVTMPWEACDAQGRPISLRVLDTIYHIRWDEYVLGEIAQMDGAVSRDPPLILISSRLTPLNTANTLLHEITHAICRMVDRKKSEFTGEDVCERAAQIATVWMDNPATFRWLDSLIGTARRPILEIARS